MPKKKKIIASLLLSAMLLLQTIVPVSASTWNLTGDTNVHDPAYIVENGTGTHWVFSTGSGIQVLYSTDGKNYQRSLPIFKEKPALVEQLCAESSGIGRLGARHFLLQRDVLFVLCDLHVRFQSIRHRTRHDKFDFRGDMERPGTRHVFE